jgi:hypothetical protein
MLQNGMLCILSDRHKNLQWLEETKTIHLLVGVITGAREVKRVRVKLLPYFL